MVGGLLLSLCSLLSVKGSLTNTKCRPTSEQMWAEAQVQTYICEYTHIYTHIQNAHIYTVHTHRHRHRHRHTNVHTSIRPMHAHTHMQEDLSQYPQTLTHVHTSMRPMHAYTHAGGPQPVPTNTYTRTHIHT